MAFNVVQVEALLIGTARSGAPITYADALAALGQRFTRPLMRQLCVALDAVDQRARGRSGPALAVLVVRQSDGLPGQGWWVGRDDYTGPWHGPEARAHVGALQRQASTYWRSSDREQAVCNKTVTAIA